MAIEPDSKDWTWVLERPCAECGYDAGQVDPSDVPQRVRDAARRMQDALAQPDPAAVSGELAAEADNVAGRFASVQDDQWSRPGRRSNGSAFTVESLGRYLVHDLVRHVHDVTRARP